jgi:hypothetical protein
VVLNLSLSLLRQFNPELSSWPSEEPLPTGNTLLVPGYLPARRSAPAVEEGVESLG